MIRKLVMVLTLMVALPCFGDVLADTRAKAEQGVAFEQYNLGLMYHNGQGVPQDYKEAVKWYRLAAEQGLARAQHNLALMYGKGQGVLQDNTKAHMWFNLGASQGDESAKKGRDIAAGMMTPTQIADAQKMARDWLAAHPDL